MSVRIRSPAPETESPGKGNPCPGLKGGMCRKDSTTGQPGLTKNDVGFISRKWRGSSAGWYQILEGLAHEQVRSARTGVGSDKGSWGCDSPSFLHTKKRTQGTRNCASVLGAGEGNLSSEVYTEMKAVSVLHRLEPGCPVRPGRVCNSRRLRQISPGGVGHRQAHFVGSEGPVKAGLQVRLLPSPPWKRRG